MKNIAILLTVHNRKDKTLVCLEYLFKSVEVLNNNSEKFNVKVYLTDDGSTDGTSEQVKRQFSNVKIINGDGSLFWNRGMIASWNEASKSNYDFYLWLNDDTILEADSLKILYQTYEQKKTIIIGSTCEILNKSKITYGGRSIKGILINPTNHPIECNHFNGNIVLIPKDIYLLLGTQDSIFRHALGDFDYGLRAHKKGVKMFIAPGILGKCDEHEHLPTWSNPKAAISKRFKHLYSPTGCNPNEFFIYDKRHYGIGSALKHYISIHLRTLLPKLWLKKI